MKTMKKVDDPRNPSVAVIINIFILIKRANH